MELPEPIAAYYAAKNRQDVEAMLAVFAEQATVRDEGATYTGRDAIKGWMEESTRRYGVTVAPSAVSRSGDEIVVDAVVTGNFPGSPATLTYRFELHGDGISKLAIG